MQLPKFGWIGMVLFLASSYAASAALLNSDTSISAGDSSFDGQDIIITNCAVTLDGAHGFNSLKILNGGRLTHTEYTNSTRILTNTVIGEVQVLSSTTPPILNNSNVDVNTILVTDSSATITYTNGIDYVINAAGQYTQLSFPATNTSSISDGATVLVSYNWAQTTNFSPGFNLVISNDVRIDASGVINLSGKGHAGGSGVGPGTSRVTSVPYSFTAGAGGGHGGYGGMSVSGAPGGNVYDSVTNPASAGSGGGVGSSSGGAGGGYGQITIGGALQLDGQILVNGSAATNAHAGGGAGGGIFISAQTFSGSGTITANGGSGELPDGGGGGGGRIAVYFATNTFNGAISAFGGTGATIGGAGTIFLQPTADSAGDLLIMNNGKRGTNTLFSQVSIRNLTVSDGAILQCSSGAVSNLFIGTNSSLLPANGVVAILFTVTGDATLQSNATISADFRSASSGSSYTSCSTSTSGTGGSHAGFGGAGSCGRNGGTITYGSITQPNTAGNAGGGLGAVPRGGGVIQLTVGGTLTVNGRISADGASGAGTAGAGGGAGGSIWITVGTFTGSGVVSASGGSANNTLGGGGSGGRLAVYFNTNSFAGIISAVGGAGANGGGAGSIYLQDNNASSGKLIVDNGGLAGEVTPLSSLPAQCDLAILRGAIITNRITASVAFGNLFIGSNSFFRLASASYPLLTASNAVIQLGGGIMADGLSVSGNGNGQSLNSTGGGGGNAGCGGNSATNALGGSSTAGSISSPASVGGSGGAGLNGNGGNGGGIINLTVAGTLQLDGKISAEGTAGFGFNSGGGAGGSVYIKTAILSGQGTISVNGGTGNNLGGGGGGGLIAVYSITNLFSGSLSAHGGLGPNAGGAGIIYQAGTLSIGGAALPGTRKMVVDNNGAIGALTPIRSPGDLSDIFDLTLAGGSTSTNSGFLDLGNLVISSNSSLVSATAFTVWTNAIIASGGKISNDGIGLRSTSTGFNGGGGGYGGAGGAPTSGGFGGNAYQDSITQPTAIGSYGWGNTVGGYGGGALKITVYGTMQLDGRISADGVAPTNSGGGGGSGGSIWLSARNLTGTGTISANGGAGTGFGGGGGGGRVSLWYDTNLFSGPISARGGAGANNGGAGTICFNSSFSAVASSPLVLADNGGLPGAPTPIFGLNNFFLTVTGGATGTNVSGVSSLRSLFIGSNSTYYLPQSMNVLGTATIQPTGKITTDGVNGGGVSVGQTSNGTGGGGGYGGAGGASSSNALGGAVYSDSMSTPQTLGSRGGSGLNGVLGGYGGGAVHLTVNGLLQVDGNISSQGLASPTANGGGGSGGAVWLQAGMISGTGIISANGGAGNNAGGGGGGGRIAIWYNTNQFTGILCARGGAGGNYGGAGTIYTTSSFTGNGNSSQLVVDNGGSRGTNTVIGALFNGDITISNGAVATMSSGVWQNLTIASNSVLNLVSGLTITILQNLSIQPGGAISVDGQGSSANSGSGHGLAAWNGTLYCGSGGGHGGLGSAGNSSASGGTSYDSITAPSQSGSGGGANPVSGSAGGGALHLTVNGMLTLDGTISANGTSATVPGAGGGAGGAVWLNVGGITGAGKVSADGGAGDPFAGGGGAGGRIALLPTSTGPTFTTNGFTGSFSARGGAGFAGAGGAGTIYLWTNAPAPLLIVDNGGLSGTNTPLSSTGGTVALILRNGALASIPAFITLNSLSITSNSTLTVASPQTQLNMTVLGDALVGPSGTIAANFANYYPLSGPGAGAVDQWGYGGGGGYGGSGGMSWLGAAGGSTYGSSNAPSDFGSPGGVWPALTSFSQGGGAIRLAVNGTLTVDGTISANGNDGIIEGSGGGSGGSVWITAKTLSGNGDLSANGGIGEFGQGGGGGGGRIALYLATNTFSGDVQATGGDGASPGQNGTIYFQTNLIISGTVLDTNGSPVAGLILQPSGLSAVMTDTNGAYTITVPPFWSGSVAPNSSPYFFIPTSRNYSILLNDATSQNFLKTASASDFSIGSVQWDSGTNFNLGWNALSGVSYQTEFSTNLVDWLPYGSAMVGTNGPMNLALPASQPQMFFRLSVSY